MEERKIMVALKKGLEAFELLVNKEIHYLYLNGNAVKELVVKAKKEQFLHLCGIKYKDPKTKKFVTARHFYELVKDDKINPKYLVVRKDGTTEQKLQVIGELKSLLTADVRVLDGQVTFYNFSFEKGLRSKRQIFALAMIEERRDSEIYVPQSLLHLKSDKSHALRTSYEVCCIFEKLRGKEDAIYYIKEGFEKDKSTVLQKEVPCS